MEVRSIDEAFGTLYLRSRIVAHGDESVNHWPSPLMLRFDAIVGDITYLLLGIPLTLAITLVAYAVGVVIALPIAVARSARVPVLSQVVQTLVEFFRTTPPLMHIVWRITRCPSSSISASTRSRSWRARSPAARARKCRRSFAARFSPSRADNGTPGRSSD